MNATTPSTGDGLYNQIIDLYGTLLLDTNLIFAVIMAWAITHFIKQSPMIAGLKPVAKRDFSIRLVSVIVGFACVIFFKRGMLDTNPDSVINFALIVAFTHPFLYRGFTIALDKFAPTVSNNLKTKSK